MSISVNQLVGIERRAAFQTDRVLDAAAELDMGMVGCRVRSPIQIMWPDVAYQSPEVESMRVIASS
jgi:hypothetical protein